MRHPYSDPFSESMLIRSVSKWLALSLGVAAVTVGNQWIRYRQLSDTASAKLVSPSTTTSICRELHSALNGSDITPSMNEIVISRGNPDDWIMKLQRVPITIPIQSVELGITNGHYGLRIILNPLTTRSPK